MLISRSSGGGLVGGYGSSPVTSPPRDVSVHAPTGLIGITYDWLALVAQLVLAVLLGIGDVLEWNSSAAIIQVCTVLGFLLVLSLILFLLGPGADRYECAVTASNMLEKEGCVAIYLVRDVPMCPQASQYMLEGLATTMVLYYQAEDNGTALVLLLCAIFLPVVLQLYDGLIVAVVMRLRGHKKVTCKMWALAVLSVIVALPAAFLKLLGLDTGLTDVITDSVEAAADIAVGEATAEDADSSSSSLPRESGRRSSRLGFEQPLSPVNELY